MGDLEAINPILKDLGDAINETIDMPDNTLSTDYDKVRADMYRELYSINFNEYKNIKSFRKIFLKPKEILFMDYVNNRRTNDYNYSLMWHYQYDLKFKDTFEKLFFGGYICFANDEKKLFSLTLKELKELLKKYSLKVSGNKKDLVIRLLTELSKDELNNILDFDVFNLTDLGNITLNSNDHIFYFHRKNYNISIDEADKIIKENPSFNKYTVALHILRERLSDFYSGNKGIYCNSSLYYHISCVYQDLGTNEKELFYLLVYYCDCMSLGYINNPPIAVSSRIKKIKEESGLTIYDLTRLIKNIKQQFKYKIDNDVYDTYIKAIMD